MSVKDSWLYKLLVINTLDSIVSIDTLIEGLIVSTFGILFGLGGFYVFEYLGYGFSAGIAKLSLLAYLAVFLYHLIAYERDKEHLQSEVGKRVETVLEIVLGIVGMLLLYVFLFDQAIHLVSMFRHAELSTGAVFLKSLPGLIILAIPLLAWEKLCKYTPVDEIVRWIFK